MTVVIDQARPSRFPGGTFARFGPAALQIGLVVAITVMTWPYVSRPPATGLDPSWQIALHVATWMDLHFGTDLVFTYGPLGFLAIPQPYLGFTSLLAMLATGAVYLAIVAVLLVEARRVVPLWAAAIIVLLIGRTFADLEPFEAFQALVLIVCIEALAGRIRASAPVVAVALGIVAGIATSGKLNVGIFIAGMGAVTAASIDRTWIRGLAWFGVAAITTVLGLWIVTGQGIGDFPAYLAGSVEIITGYSQAMGADRDTEILWVYPAFVAIAGLFLWTAYRASIEWPRRRRIGLALLCVIVVFALWKIAFTRYSAPYSFATFLIAVTVLGAQIRDRTLWIMSILAIAIAFAGSARLVPGSYVDVMTSARSFASQALTAVVPGRAERAEARNRAYLRKRYGLDEAAIAELAGRRVSIDPVESGAAFAYPEMTWAPLPTFQSYSAYTSALDRRNAEHLASADAPERILRNVQFIADPPDWLARQRGQPLAPGESIPFVVDGRFRWFEAPAAMLETFCRYRELSATDAWQILGLSGDSCGAPESLGSVTVREGDEVVVPRETRPNRFVIARVSGLEPTIVDRIKTTLFKADDWYVTLPDARYRLVAPTASDGLLLAVPPSADGSGAFSFGPPIESLSIDSGRRGGERTLTYEFESVPIVRP